jgi:hypothetical protein
MSKGLKKFRKNDYNDDQEYSEDPRNKVNKNKEKRINRALRTKDIDALIEQDDEYDEYLEEDLF